jgi:hypothetical protein
MRTNVWCTGALAAVKSMLEGTSESSSGSSAPGQQQQQLSGATPTERELEWGKAGPTLLHACVTIASWITNAAASTASAAAAASTADDGAATAATEDSSSDSTGSAEDAEARAQGRLLIAQLLLDWVGPGGTPDIACLDDSGLTVSHT